MRLMTILSIGILIGCGEKEEDTAVESTETGVEQ